MKRTHCTAALLALFSLLSFAHAETTTTQPFNVPQTSITAARGLSPEQIAAIRKVGRNVLAAKKSGQEDGSDAAQLASLRASVDALITANLAPENRAAIAAQDLSNGGEPRGRRARADGRESARAQARALVSQLRQRSEIKSAQFRSSSEAQVHSAGLAIGEQRARLFERLAQKLDVALTDDGVNRASHLRELRTQLEASFGGVSEAPLNHGTPTLQAMPSGYVAPKKDGQQNSDADAPKK
ncbi:hypothetical protein EV672_11710 [Aquabacterium commune]|uniref:DUF4142 domain-containing protein n=1 Tax=Aquabacterium commune TaxID=70586 RepID=A0A4R6QZI0_9BURK|nr:hypothetical protein [Aquabacterium commune]TDP78732.1 hypothetical protein EV672_11710 [Aquabacterium commune]